MITLGRDELVHLGDPCDGNISDTGSNKYQSSIEYYCDSFGFDRRWSEKNEHISYYYLLTEQEGRDKLLVAFEELRDFADNRPKSNKEQ